MAQGISFSEYRENATDEEIMTALRVALERGGRLPRMAELFLSSVSAEHVLTELRGAGLEIVRSGSPHQ